MALRVATVVGARPQFVKMAVLSKELRKRFRETIIHTGQHYDREMDAVFFEELGLPRPDYNLGVGSGSHGFQTGEMLKRIEEVFVRERPDIVLVYGDTNSTLAGALAAAKLGIPVAHVEAGVRCFDRSMPEEINRVLTDHCSTLLFCPTQRAVDNLAREGITEGVHLTGDVMVDSLLAFRPLAEEKSNILEVLGLKPGGYVLATVHRAENTDRPESLTKIVRLLSEMGETVVFPVHPRAEKRLAELGLVAELASSVVMTKPLGYLDFLKLLAHSRKVLTDSGGVQKEAYVMGVPCVTLRKTTEWMETVEGGWNALCPVEGDVGSLLEVVRAPLLRHGPQTADLFSDGEASKRVATLIDAWGVSNGLAGSDS